MREQNHQGKEYWVMKARAVLGWRSGEEIEEHAAHQIQHPCWLPLSWCFPTTIDTPWTHHSTPENSMVWLLESNFWRRALGTWAKAAQPIAFTCSSEGFNHTTVQKEYEQHESRASSVKNIHGSISGFRPNLQRQTAVMQHGPNSFDKVLLSRSLTPFCSGQWGAGNSWWIPFAKQ